jgi:hypothetical protein
MANRLLDRQRSLLAHLTSGAAIFGEPRAPVDPALAGIDPGLLHLEARFSHEKRMDKIAGVFPRTLKLIGGERASIERAFAQACPPAAIGRLENARQLHDFLLIHWLREPPRPSYLPDLAACELAFAEARRHGDEGQADDRVEAMRNCSAKPRAIRRHPGVVLLRCGFDIRALFETRVIEPPPAKRDVALAIATPPGAADPGVFELDNTVFELLAALDDWTGRRAFGETPEAQALIADLAAHGLLEFRV